MGCEFGACRPSFETPDFGGLLRMRQREQTTYLRCNRPEI
jgi:hypothetical protein